MNGLYKIFWKILCYLYSILSFREEVPAADLSGTKKEGGWNWLEDRSNKTPALSAESFEPGRYRPIDGPEIVNPMDPKEVSDAEAPPPTFEPIFEKNSGFRHFLRRIWGSRQLFGRVTHQPLKPLPRPRKSRTTQSRTRRSLSCRNATKNYRDSNPKPGSIFMRLFVEGECQSISKNSKINKLE